MAGRARAFRAFGGVYGAFGAVVVFVAFVVFLVFAAFVLFSCASLVFGWSWGVLGLGSGAFAVFVVFGCLMEPLWSFGPLWSSVPLGPFHVLWAVGCPRTPLEPWRSDALTPCSPGTPARRRAQSREATHARSSEAVPSQLFCDYFSLGDGQCCSARACDIGGLKRCRRGVSGGTA